ncbi:exo-1,3-beta-glucanase, partial [Blyttiomyces sp. JEL0837]
LQQWACSGTPNQKWIAHTGNDAVDPVAPCKSDQTQCSILLYSDDFHSLSVCIVSPTDAYQDVLFDRCDTTSKFIFSVHDDGDGYMHITSDSTSLCLTYYGAKVQLSPCNQHKSEQKWGRRALNGFSDSFAWNMGFYQTMDGSNCLTITSKGVTMAPCSSFGGIIDNQNFMVLAQTDVLRLGSAPTAPSYGGSNDPKIHGVNLGGWLVLEPWITPSLLNYSGVTDHYSFCANAPNVNKLMNDHVNTFITQNDIKTLAGYGINHLRVPVGYWDLGLGLNPDENAYDNCNVNFLSTIQNLCNWARPLNMKIIFDLHGAPGSQNGRDHSGRYGKTNFWTPYNVKRGVMSVGILADMAVMAECNGVVVGIDVLNEPAINNYDGADHIKLNHFWRRAYDKVRYPPSLKGVASNLWVILNPYNQDLAGYMNGRFSSAGGFQYVMADTHNYQMFSLDLMARDGNQMAQQACSDSRTIGAVNGNMRTIVGEWSAAINDCDAPYLVTEWGAYPGYRWPLFKSCSPYHWWDDGKPWPRDDGPFNDDHRDRITQSVNSQMSSFQAGAGWFFWTAKTEGILYTSHQWDFLWLAKNGFVPNLNNPKSYC